MRIVSATLVSPLLGLLVVQIFRLAWILGMDGILTGKLFRALTLGLVQLSVVYVYIVLVSIPVFFVVRRIMGLMWWSTVAAAAIVVMSLILITSLYPETQTNAILAKPHMIIGSAAGTATYGLIYWAIMRKTKQEGARSETNFR